MWPKYLVDHVLLAFCASSAAGADMPVCRIAIARSAPYIPHIDDLSA
jgi:hypothetical protein